MNTRFGAEKRGSSNDLPRQNGRKRLLLVLALVGTLGASLWVWPSRAVGLDVSGAFTDDDGNSHEPNIEAIAAQGITKGCGTRQYCPGDPVKRDQMATFLARAFQLAATPSAVFTDTAGNIHEGDINAISAVGITAGCAPGRYCPGDPVRRDQMATFLVRALDLVPLATGPFSDIAGNPHARDINALAAAGITAGCGPGFYCPSETVRRDQMATFLARALRLPVRYIRLPLSQGLPVACTRDGLACTASVIVPYRSRYELREGFYQVLPYAPGEEAALVDPGTRVEIIVDGSLVALGPLPVDMSSGRAVRNFRGEVTLTAGAHRIVARWIWRGLLTQTNTIDLWVSG